MDDIISAVQIQGALSEHNRKIVTEKRILAMRDDAEATINFYLNYPDRLLDDMTPVGSHFKLFFYQRIFLRACIRFRYMFATFPRAFSKSFLAILALYIRCMLLPGSKVFICADVKEQAAKIATEKIKEIWDLFPMLKNEMSDTLGSRPKFERDFVSLTFKNGSILDVVGVLNSTRGGRRHAGLIEEAALIDGEALGTVVLPLMNISRRTKAGILNSDEPHHAQLYVTTAGFKDTFAYQKMIQLLAWSVVKPELAFVWGGDYRIPVLHGLLSSTYVEEMRQDSTFKETSFSREYGSKWSGDRENSFFASQKLDSHRTIKRAEYHSTNHGEDTFYVLSVDVGRLVSDTVVIVFRVNIRQDYFLKNVVNIYTFNKAHFQHQAANIKALAAAYNAREIVIDGNGLGVGLLDYMIQETVCPVTGNVYPAIGTSNDEEYMKKQPVNAEKLIYVIKANYNTLGEIHSNVLLQVNAGKVRFLVDERVAKAKLSTLVRAKTMNQEQRATYVMPYQLTTILMQEMLNQRRKDDDAKGIALTRASRSLGQDKFSALEYGLWHIKDIEDTYYKRLRNKKSNMSAFIMMSGGGEERAK